MKESVKIYIKGIFLKYGEKVKYRVGQSLSSDKNKGAAVGAMVGMVAGNIYAKALEEQEKSLRTDLAGSGALIYNTTSKKFQGYDGSAWRDLH